MKNLIHTGVMYVYVCMYVCKWVCKISRVTHQRHHHDIFWDPASPRTKLGELGYSGLIKNGWRVAICVKFLNLRTRGENRIKNNPARSRENQQKSWISTRYMTTKMYCLSVARDRLGTMPNEYCTEGYSTQFQRNE